MDHIEKAIAHFEKDIEKTRRRVGMFETGILRVEDIGCSPPRNVTNEAVAFDRGHIENIERAIELLKAMKAG